MLNLLKVARAFGALTIPLCIVATGVLKAQTSSYTLAQSYNLESGGPLMNASVNGYGRMALPFYNGFIMGLASVTSDKKDLFLQGTDGHGRGFYLYSYKKLSPKGVPVFVQPVKLTAPFKDGGDNRGVIFQNNKNKIYSFWKFGSTLRWADFDKKTLAFSELHKINVKGLPRGFTNFGLVQLKNSKYLFLFTVREEGVFSNGEQFPKKITYTAEGFWPYELAKSGIYGAVVDNPEQEEIKAVELTALNQSLFSIDGYSLYSEPQEDFVLTGSRLGTLSAYKLDNERLSPRRYLVDKEGIILRNPNVGSSVAYFYDSSENQGLFTLGEGGIYYYKNTRKKDAKGNLIFNDPEHLLSEHTRLHGGSLVVPNVTDWDADGKLDLIAGNSMGFIFFFKNIGTNEKPAYMDPEYLKAGDKIIHIQPGYREDIQGPGEARWGYTCPTVADWNADGLPDILMGDSRGKFMVFLNIGTKNQPKLDTEHTLYLDGMDLYGTWRVKPGVGKMADKMAYIIMDRDDHFHLYWQIDKYNLEDKGKLTIGDSIPIRGNRLGGGTVGRGKFEIVDWDEDGVKDLLVGTYGKQSIPDTISGLPVNMKPKRGSTVLFLRNSGTEQRPVYEYPKILKFKGQNISLGGHSCAPATAKIGDKGALNLVVGIETGAFIYYSRKDLSW
ncbi:FG-GAP repeat domain-containing protein [Desertivirga xinjiangensis]|uniref:FG-GAP repeat domain-containing protein n=1 Tax=Desertivirga xinjiangensis TaxID=539206 RepID=UPI00210A1169|nr:VCBS repeat-containing protein [Pedobacter xinjiangensis]